MTKRFFMKSKILKVTRKELHILVNEKEGQQVGAFVRQMREERGISVAEMAKHIGISHARVKRFETGEPVQDAKMIETAYRNHFKYLSLNDAVLEALEKLRWGWPS